MRMHIAELWASLILAHTSTFLLVGSQFVGPFPDQRPVQQQQRQQNSQVQPQQQADGQQQPVSDLGYSDKRAASTLSEPTCEELRAMWRYSKRQSRAAESTNELPVYRDPFSYNVWDAYPGRPGPSNSYRDDYTGPARSRSSGAPIYGKLVHKAPAGRLRNGMPERTRAFEEVARLYGTVNRHPPNQRRKLTSFRVGGGLNTSPPQAGKFQHLKELILSERARELQEQRKVEEMAARAAVLKDITSGDRRSDDSSSSSRNANFLSSLQSYREPSSRYDFDQQAQYVADEGPDIGQSSFSKKADHYGRNYMQR